MPKRMAAGISFSISCCLCEQSSSVLLGGLATIHTLRHSIATHLLDDGVDLQVFLPIGDNLMKLSAMFIIYAVISAIFGLTFIFVPETSLALYGITLSPGGVPMVRLFGVALLEFALLSWFVRNAGDSEARKAIILAMFIGEAVGFVVALLGQLSGVVNALGWSTVAVYLLLALGFGYFQFVIPSTA
jgi:hypothetical protein